MILPGGINLVRSSVKFHFARGAWVAPLSGPSNPCFRFSSDSFAENTLALFYRSLRFSCGCFHHIITMPAGRFNAEFVLITFLNEQIVTTGALADLKNITRRQILKFIFKNDGFKMRCLIKSHQLVGKTRWQNNT